MPHFARSSRRTALAARCSQRDRSTDQERTPIAAHEGVLAGGIEALYEHAPAPGALGSVVVPVSVVRVPHAGSTSALTVTDTARFGAPVGWWPGWLVVVGRVLVAVMTRLAKSRPRPSNPMGGRCSPSTMTAMSAATAGSRRDTVVAVLAATLASPRPKRM